MTLLAVSVAVLVLGPVLVHGCRGRAAVLMGLDVFVLVTIAGLVLFHLIPESILLAGSWAVGAAALGLLLPVVTHRVAHSTSDHGLAILLPFALLGLIAHAFIDGIALSESISGHGDHAQLLPLGVVLHRLPMGMAVWWIVEPRAGWKAALGILAIIVGATCGGFFSADYHGLTDSTLALGVVQALVAGSLLHVVQHHSPAVEAHAPSSRACWVGAFVGALVIAGLSLLHPAAEHFELQPLGLWMGVELVAVFALSFALMLFYRHSGHDHGHDHGHGHDHEHGHDQHVHDHHGHDPTPPR